LRDRAILSVGLQVGLRRAEIAALKVGDLHQNRGYDSLRVIRKGDPRGNDWRGQALGSLSATESRFTRGDAKERSRLIASISADFVDVEAHDELSDLFLIRANMLLASGALAAFAVLRGPDDGGCGPEEDKSVTADRRHRKAMVQEEDAKPAEEARQGRERPVHQRQTLHRFQTSRFLRDPRRGRPSPPQQSLCGVGCLDEDFSRMCVPVAVCVGSLKMKLPDDRNSVVSQKLQCELFMKCQVGLAVHQFEAVNVGPLATINARA